MSEFEWCSDYPNQCPPCKAEAKDILPVYRFVKKNKLTEQQFYPNNKTIKKVNYTVCDYWGVSLFDSKKNIDDFRAKVSAFRHSKWKYAEGTINKNFGVSIIREDGHINLWRYKNVTIHKSFRII